jgi:hypothetical protein
MATILHNVLMYRGYLNSLLIKIKNEDFDLLEVNRWAKKHKPKKTE